MENSLEELQNSETDSKSNSGLSLLSGSKGLIALGIIVIIISIYMLAKSFGSGSSEAYQGMIQRVEQETINLTE